jgi:1-pyrroline-5-carboxylate dehydrogenase
MSFRVPEPVNERVLGYAPGSPERAELKRELELQSGSPVVVTSVIGGERRSSGPETPIVAPHRHELVLGHWSAAADADVDLAIQRAMEARAGWASRSLTDRAAVFLRAAALLAGPWRQRLNAATMLGQSKTPHQAEVDAAAELVDFFRFNAWFAQRLADDQPISTPAEWNRIELRPLDGFVYAVTPFNFTSIAGNLPTAPAVLGNTVVWKPSPHALLSASHVMQLLEAAGLPPGVVNLVVGDAELITKRVLDHANFAGLHFTGSTAVLRQLWRKIGDNLQHYGCYPRIVGETGGKGFILAHPSASLPALAAAVVRGGFEFQGQKCSAASRLYVPRSSWRVLEPTLRELVAQIRVGDIADFGNFMGAVIGRHAHQKITGFLELARQDPGCRFVTGGGARTEGGYFIDPTLVEVSDPRHRLMTEEIFGPVVSAFVYDDDRFEEVLTLCDETSRYALTGAVFAEDRAAVELAAGRLSGAAGNFYVNDKPTGAVVGQQPFGGSRWSGTNDKAGSALNLSRWTSVRTIKEGLNPPTDFRYPFLSES